MRLGKSTLLQQHFSRMKACPWQRDLVFNNAHSCPRPVSISTSPERKWNYRKWECTLATEGHYFSGSLLLWRPTKWAEHLEIFFDGIHLCQHTARIHRTYCSLSSEKQQELTFPSLHDWHNLWCGNSWLFQHLKSQRGQKGSLMIDEVGRILYIQSQWNVLFATQRFLNADDVNRWVIRITSI